MPVITTHQPAETTTRRGPGRPRAEGHDERILTAAVDLIRRGEEVTVTRVVEASGVSRAALYRRWTSMTDLVAAAMDQGRAPHTIPLEGDLLENLVAAYTQASSAARRTYSDERFRMRIRLAMTDRKLAQAYWRSHVSRRRAGVVALLQEGIDRGQLRPDIDIGSCIDLINGVIYYQIVVRGASFADAAARQRCAEAIRIAWRGMSVRPEVAAG